MLQTRNGQDAVQSHSAGFGPDDTAVLAFREICEIEIEMEVEDGIAFDPASVKGSVIRKEAGYGGVRIDLQA